ncbi:MAG: class I tRNA ligase family protein [Pseudomonadota bacterium]
MDIEALKSQIERPSKAIITGGMPYTNGPIHLGHLAGAHVPPDIFARWMRMLIGAENVLFVCGTDDHGSTSEISANKAGLSIRDFIDRTHTQQKRTFDRYGISFDTFTGTSAPECFPFHKDICQEFLTRLEANKLLDKKVSRQWYDPKIQRFLQDRFVTGRCPNTKCENESAYSDQCETCGTTYDPSELIDPKSSLSDARPELKDTLHWWLNLWEVSEELRMWIQSKEKKWRAGVFNEVIHTVLPGLKFSNTHEDTYKALKETLPKHKSKYAAGKKIALTFDDKSSLIHAKAVLLQSGIDSEFLDSWAHRSITRDVSWGVPLPESFGSEGIGKSLYVWPDSLMAPIAFTKVALAQKNKDPKDSDLFWKDPKAKIYQFLGQDNVYYYVLMQGALWFGSQKNPHQIPQEGEYQLTDIFSSFHLMVSDAKMSKSTGNSYSADQLLDEFGYSPEQIRYFLALLSLPEKSSNFDFEMLKERNRFLAGPLNAAFEKPISACHSKFNGQIPEGQVSEKIINDTTQMIKKYFKSMEKAEYSTLLYALENYARSINSQFTQFKPHDDRAPLEQRQNALVSCFYLLKNLMIMLYPFVPTTMDKLRLSLNLPESVFSVDQLGIPLPAHHTIGTQEDYFPKVE